MDIKQKKPFNSDIFTPESKVVTRKGFEVKIISVNSIGDYPVIGIEKYNSVDEGFENHYTKDGRRMINSKLQYLYFDK